MPDPTAQPNAGAQSPYVANMQAAITAYNAMPPAQAQSQIGNLKTVLQANYDKVAPSGYFASGDGQQIGHILRGAWGVEDPTQGGQIAPVAVNQVANSAKSALGSYCGPDGCANFVSNQLKDSGLPYNPTASAAGMESGLLSNGWQKIPVDQAIPGDVIGGPGTGPSGRHVGIFAGNGQMYADPGKSSGYKATVQSVPEGETYAYRAPVGATLADKVKQDWRNGNSSQALIDAKSEAANQTQSFLQGQSENQQQSGPSNAANNIPPNMFIDGTSTTFTPSELADLQKNFSPAQIKQLQGMKQSEGMIGQVTSQIPNALTAAQMQNEQQYLHNQNVARNQQGISDEDKGGTSYVAAPAVSARSAPSSLWDKVKGVLGTLKQTGINVAKDVGHFADVVENPAAAFDPDDPDYAQVHSEVNALKSSPTFQGGLNAGTGLVLGPLSALAPLGASEVKGIQKLGIPVSQEAAQDAKNTPSYSSTFKQFMAGTPMTRDMVLNFVHDSGAATAANGASPAEIKFMSTYKDAPIVPNVAHEIITNPFGWLINTGAAIGAVAGGLHGGGVLEDSEGLKPGATVNTPDVPVSSAMKLATASMIERAKTASTPDQAQAYQQVGNAFSDAATATAGISDPAVASRIALSVVHETPEAAYVAHKMNGATDEQATQAVNSAPLTAKSIAQYIGKSPEEAQPVIDAAVKSGQLQDLGNGRYQRVEASSEPTAPVTAPTASVAPSVEAMPNEPVQRPAPQAPISTEEAGKPTAPAQITVTPSPLGKYERSINTETGGYTPEQRAQLHEGVESGKIPLPEPFRQSQEDTNKAAQASGVTPTELRTLTPGKFPEGMGDTPAGQRAHIRNVLNLAKSLKLQGEEALAEHDANPSPESEAKLAQVNADRATVLGHQQALANISGGNLGAFSQPGDETMAVSVQRRLQEAASSKANTTFKTPRTAAKTWGARNVGVTLDQANEIRARLGAAKLPSISTLVKDEGGWTDVGVLKDLTDLGRFHIEAGARSIGDFVAKMQQDVPGLSENDAKEINVHARAAILADRNTRNSQLATDTFTGPLAQKLGGLDNASKFLQQINPDGQGIIRDKLINQELLSDNEKQIVHQAYEDNKPNRSTKNPSATSLKTLNAVLKETQGPRTTPNLTPEQRVNRSLSGRVGAANMTKFEARVNSTAEGTSGLAKLRAGTNDLTTEEKGRIASALDDLGKPRNRAAENATTNYLSGIVRDAKAGKLVYEDPRETANEWILRSLPDNDNRESIARLLAGEISSVDTKGGVVTPKGRAQLSNIIQRYANHGFFENLKMALQSGLLSGPGTLAKIAISHLMSTAMEDSAVRGLASTIDLARSNITGSERSVAPPNLGVSLNSMKVGLNAGRRDTAQIMRGGLGSVQLDRNTPILHEGRMYGKEYTGDIGAMNAVVRTPMRVHSALYHMIGSGIYDRGLQEGAWLKASRELGKKAKAPDVIAKAKEYYEAPTPDIMDHARDHWKSQMFTNDNVVDGAYKWVLNKAPASRLVLDPLLPFARVPLNLAGRALEHTAPGAAASVLNQLLKRAPAGMSAESLSAWKLARQANIAKTVSRGVIGTGLLTALGYELYRNGKLNAPDEQKYEHGSINAFGRKIDINQLQPLSTPLLAGATIGKYMDDQKAGLSSPMGSYLLPYIGDTPYSKLSGIGDAVSQGGNKLKSFAGGVAGETVPTLFSQVAATTDPAHSIRAKSNVSDYIVNRVPGARETLPLQRDISGNTIPESGGLAPLPSIPITPSTPLQTLLNRYDQLNANKSTLTEAQRYEMYKIQHLLSPVFKAYAARKSGAQ